MVGYAGLRRFFFSLPHQHHFFIELPTLGNQGTNIRATVTTSVPNFIRAALVPISIVYTSLQAFGIQKLSSALITGVACCVIAFIAASLLHESYHKDLDYHEEH